MTRGLRLLSLVFVVGCLGMASSECAAAPVEYVKICPLYGAGFHYIPGTDTCFDASTNDARQQTVGGTWRWRIPNNPRTWVSKPEDACKGGRVVKVGDLTAADLVPNAHDRYETKTPYLLRLKPGQFVASVLYKGGFTPPKDYAVSALPACPSANAYVDDATDANCTAGAAPVGGGTGPACEVTCVNGAWQFTGNNTVGHVGAGNFCLYYLYLDPAQGGPVYSFPLGCIDTAAQATASGTLAFSPDAPDPPATDKDIYILGANGESWGNPAEIQGTLSVSLCVRHEARSRRGH